MSFIGRAWDNFRGNGDFAITIPPMDGVLRPNSLLEGADSFLNIEGPDNLVHDRGKTFFSSGAELHELNFERKSSRSIKTFPAKITCFAPTGDGGFVVGLESGKVHFWSSRGDIDNLVLDELDGRSIRCPTAVLVARDGSIILCLGSQECDVGEWKRDLMSRNSSGSIWKIWPGIGKKLCLADDLAFPCGIVDFGEAGFAYSEAWRSRLMVHGSNGVNRTAFVEVPGYPGRLHLDADTGDIWMAVFAPRNQLVEFVLREKDYRTEMIDKINPDYWIAPTFYPPQTYREPLQGGALKQLGALKEWAPSRSYGLVVRLDKNLQPVQSFHSRAGGRRHGIVSCLNVGNDVLVASRGNNEIFKLDPGPSDK